MASTAGFWDGSEGDPAIAPFPSASETQSGKDVRVVSNLVTGDIPISDEGVVSVGERCIVSHGGWASVGVFAVGEELPDGIQGVRLNGIVGCEYDELRDIIL